MSQQRIPSYRLHKPSGLAVVTIDGKDFYLNQHGTEESKAEYDRMIQEWLLNGRRLPAQGNDITINELLMHYLQWAEVYYRRPDGSPSGETDFIKVAIRPLRRLYGHTLAKDFGPLALKAIREWYVTEAKLCRNECNKRTRRIIRIFKWGTENEHVPASVFQSLKCISGLKRGRCEARETDPVKPVDDADVDVILKHVLPPIRAMIELQRLTGMRPGEVIVMRTGDIDRSGKVWVYEPESHKTEHHGYRRLIPLGPKAQEILKHWLKADPTAVIFSPRDAMEQVNAERRQNRKSPMTPSQRRRKRKAKPKRQPAEAYTVCSYRRAIYRGCEKAKIPRWHPHQLRHAAATRIRREYDLETARAILGHQTPVVTEIYAEADLRTARAVMEKIG